MKSKKLFLISLLIVLIQLLTSAKEVFYNVIDFGAKADGKINNTASINSAIETAARNGGGTVYFPAGEYLSFTIHLKSNISLYLDQGAVLIGDSEENGVGYDLPEADAWYKKFQDFGHSYWQNSLIFGDSLKNISIIGNGMIWGRGLYTYDKPDIKGSGNKAIALKNCTNVTIRDISILHGGHFCILSVQFPLRNANPG